MKKLKIAALQFLPSPTNRKTNLQRTAAQIRKLSPAHDLVVLPELSSPGYSEQVFKNQYLYAEDACSGPSHAFYSALAKETGMHIAYGILRLHENSESEETKRKISISHVVLAPGVDEPIAIYDKIHLCQVGKCSEVNHGITPGVAKPCVFDVAGVRVGLCICYDLRFPELWRALAWGNNNADVILHPSAFVRDTTFPTWHQFVTTRAVENGVYVVSVSFAGEYFGDSIVCPPWVGTVQRGNGEITESGVDIIKGTAEGVLSLKVDLEFLRDVRLQAPLREDARMYK
mmetsp:Transcript_27687/g.33846  ORF Transcript_27687/g.33846 Transcript_27687/m.33846 type:complete len:287 (+) Transcript_27687:63-923(+)